MRVAFVVGAFPVRTEPFIINQIADLIDLGVAVDVFSFIPGDVDAISERYKNYRMHRLVRSLYAPKSYGWMLLAAIPRLLRGVIVDPRCLWTIVSTRGRCIGQYASKALFRIEPFLGREYDIVHCHFGTVANEYLPIRRFIGQRSKLVTTFYGYDASVVLRTSGAEVYDELKRESDLFFVMSSNMKARLEVVGFDPQKITVLPVSIDVDAYPFKERTIRPGEAVEVVSVGRFVEKKGFDDIVRAVRLLKSRLKVPFRVRLVGGGPQEAGLRKMTDEFELADTIEFKGYMPVEQVVDLLLDSHLFVQPSKTASNGDME